MSTMGSEHWDRIAGETDGRWSSRCEDKKADLDLNFDSTFVNLPID